MSTDTGISVLFDTSPLKGGHAMRGIGMYTRELYQQLQKLSAYDVKKDSVALTSRNYLIHYPYFDLFFATLPLFSRHRRVVTIHDVIPLLYPEFYKPGKKGFLRFQKQKLALKKVSAVITDSQASKEDIHQYLHVPLEKIAVVHLAANPHLSLKELPNFLRVRNRYDITSKYVLYVGDINYNKNIPQLIKTIKFLPEDVQLVCVGRNFKPQNIPEWQWIETQIALSDVAKRVVFVPNILTENNKDLAALYHNAECYVQPSLAEGFGLPVLEAMKMRTPVISSNTTSLPEVGGDCALYCEPTAEAFAGEIEKVLNWKKSEKKTWLDNAQQWSETFSWEATAEKTADIYRKVQEGRTISE